MQEVVYEVKEPTSLKDISIRRVSKNSKAEEIPEDEDKVWRSCCLELSPRCIVYSGQFSISMVVLAISFYMLIRANGDCNQSSGYINLIAFLLGKLLNTVATSA